MSSWIIAKSIPKKTVTSLLTPYHDTSTSSDIPSIFMEVLAAYIYSQKLGNSCAIWDPTDILSSSIKYNPQVKLLKEKPNTPVMAPSTYVSILSSMTFKQIQKFAFTLIEYTPVFNQTIYQILEKSGMKQGFDIGLHISSITASDTMTGYINIVKAYQAKSKKASLSIYIMTDSYDTVKEFQKMGSPSWKTLSLSKNAPKEASDQFLQMMADVEILKGLPAVVLDFKYSIDRYIYLMQSNPIGYSFFKEVNDKPWQLF